MSSRRGFVQGLAAASGVVAAAPAYAMRCAERPNGGAAFQAGQDVRSIAVRKPLSAYSQAESAQLRAAYAAMRALPRNDPRSWLRQADFHASYCRQCDAGTAQVHGSWSFLPWHRAFLYYHERILGALSGNLDGFRLPCWEWESRRAFPQSYIVPANAGNALWDAKRNGLMLSGYPLPASDATGDRIALLEGIADFLTFGGGPATGGAFEIDPHNAMHVDIGMQEPPWTDMGNLGYSARDPLFYAHHANIDKLWSRWNALGRLNPAQAQFLTMRWTFYDEYGSPVSISAADVLDHRQNLRYAYEDKARIVAPLLATYDCRLLCCARGGAALKASDEVKARVLSAARRGGKIALVLPRFPIPNAYAGIFDIVAYGRAGRAHMGNLVFTDDAMHLQEHRRAALVLDAADAIEGLLAAKNPTALYAPARYGGEPFALETQAAQLRIRV
jgi:polyphenol oxidase